MESNANLDFDSSEDLDPWLTIRAAGLYFNRFRLVNIPGKEDSLLGKGGMGVVHLVQDDLLKRQVALKIAPEEIRHDDQARSDMMEETRRALDLTHPNIVRIYDYHEAEDSWGISMQYVRGKNLTDIRADRARETGQVYTFDPEEIRPWLVQVCDAIIYAHEKASMDPDKPGGMVHRDLTPRNLMIEMRHDSKGEAYEHLLVTDFGITEPLRHSLLQTLTPAQATAMDGPGARPYVCYQQVSGRSARVSDDIYSLGATIYDLLSSRPPFYAKDINELHLQIEKSIPPGINERRKELGLEEIDIPPGWEELVAACLEKDPANRPESVREIALRLDLNPDRQYEKLYVESQAALRKARSSAGTGVRLRPVLLLLILMIGLGAAGGWYWGRREIPDFMPRGLEAVGLPVRDEDFTNGFGMELKPMAGGRFIATSPVTKEQYDRYLEHLGIAPEDAYVEVTRDYYEVDRGDPARGLSAIQGDEFCKWLTDMERGAGNLPDSQAYRLPESEEWSFRGIDKPAGLREWTSESVDEAGRRNLLPRDETEPTRLPFLPGADIGFRCVIAPLDGAAAEEPAPAS